MIFKSTIRTYYQSDTVISVFMWIQNIFFDQNSGYCVGPLHLVGWVGFPLRWIVSCFKIVTFPSRGNGKQRLISSHRKNTLPIRLETMLDWLSYVFVHTHTHHKHVITPKIANTVRVQFTIIQIHKSTYLPPFRLIDL